MFTLTKEYQAENPREVIQAENVAAQEEAEAEAIAALWLEYDATERANSYKGRGRRQYIAKHMKE